jgi:hypothetical protein
LIVPRNRVAIVDRLARPAKSAKDVVGLHGSVERAAGGVELATSLGEDRHSRVHDLHDVIGADREGIIGWVPQLRGALWPDEPNPKPIEARDCCCRRTCAL